ncbi:hypothetical protein O6H91_01G064100 [Diphasiastrum complanatum]|uniref:Uncharacterized protein n=5 Tax=Diphasiastrum complanatum TaxID=34168 RepID=A0ACC2ERZ7_DIPCM|nr:hypothetical protein O6H91_01G064100 [Diphasiastrum complanatum]KAJ7569165.1 hypothetical protein O6H91_01G064100 [Diphasiastrum complanatum]KAJ7569166.1 hypothetical protein O6H91_01G064100 [Diphasiastrum complanatum]KAJ7569167.1 hypothetical protein O6H91_01G064100 [Diphasiastrum complanatum]KAJ7569168.1 hypothetical protein O6H91_01G064100 [Diphasiastrum complanatum]
MHLVGNGLEMAVEGKMQGRTWTLPNVEGKGLCVNNSLCGSKVPFRSSDGSRHVSWYICGPTVYDASHIGHARNYLTFDIIRRILEGYFGYHVHYVMNVTDVDDKIINRARRNHLLERYVKNVTKIHTVIEDVSLAFEEETRKQQKKIIMTETELEKVSSSRQKEELDDKLRQENLKLHKLKQAREVFEKLKDEDLSTGNPLEILLSGDVADVLASQLDAKEGATVTDHEIFRAHAARYENDFFEDMENLGVKPPDVLTRVTEYIDAIKEYVQRIIEHKCAYAANGSVYFDTKAFLDSGHEYGKLNPWAVGSLGLSSESESNFDTKEKKNTCDFALWKASKPGEPFWDSPWGHGRPGWHIECSAMASDMIGEKIDIHSGGNDLMFPHHDNELAQAEAYHGCFQWVNYFWHSGHLSIDGLKMSKSLKNFITIKDALKKYSSRQLRLLFVIQAWDKPVHFSEAVMNEAIGKEKQLLNFFKIVKNSLKKACPEGDSLVQGLHNNQRFDNEDFKLQRSFKEAQSQVQQRLEDNFDTAGALLALLNLISAVHLYFEKMVGGNVKLLLVRKVAEYVTKILQVFGLSNASENEIGFGSDSSTKTDNAENVLGPYLDAISSFRDQIRAAAKAGVPKESILQLADDFRDRTCVDLGVRLEDTQGGSIWELVDPNILRSERDDKLQKAAEANLKKLESHRDRKMKDLEKLEAAALAPKEYFIEQIDKYSAFDDRGLPTHSADGKDLSNKAKRDVEKLMKKKEDEHKKFTERLNSNPALLQNLRNEIAELTSQITQLRPT